MTRAEFVKGVTAGAAFAALSGRAETRLKETKDFSELQKEIDQVKGSDFRRYLESGEISFDAIERLDNAFTRVLEGVKSAKNPVKPMVWFLYNMGIIVKTKTSCFSVDLMHRRAVEFEPLLDFALITHNHNDHYTREFYRAMDRAHKTVINNFECNYGVRDYKNHGGYTRAKKTFQIGDVEIRTALSDHNEYLVDFTSTFEISTGGMRIFHSGDSSNLAKLNPKKKPDLWFVHPRCGVKAAEGVKKFAPKTTVIAHLNELGHDQWRWSWQQGLEEKAAVEATGGKALVPLWGDRIIY